MLRVEKLRGVVVVYVIWCVCLDGLLFQKRLTKGVEEIVLIPPFSFFFSCSFEICKHLIFTQVTHTGGRINMNVWGCEQDFTAIPDCFLRFRFLH